MSDDLLSRARAALEGVTEGPWESDWDPADNWFSITAVPQEKHGHMYVCPEVTTVEGERADAHFIAAARTLVPELVAEVERLRTQLDLGALGTELVDARAAVERLIAENAELRAKVERIEKLRDHYRDRLPDGTGNGRAVNTPATNAHLIAVWRREHPDTRLTERHLCDILGVTDLRRADLSGADLSGADLSGADLRRADLHGAELPGTVYPATDGQEETPR